ncbi:MAG: hypothetical protein K9M57_02120 [Phycisphaerae bacterium]|nr:hypothetical protein [Phycisphaerae bacterium]
MKNIFSCMSCQCVLLFVVAVLFRDAYANEPVVVDLDAEYTNEFYIIQNQRTPHENSPLPWQAYRAESLTLKSDRDATDVILRRTEVLIAHIHTLPGAPDLKDLQGRLGQLGARVKKTDVKDIAGRLDLFKAIATVRREVTLSNPLLDFSKILLVKSRLSREHHCCDQYFGKGYSPGGSVYVLSDAFGAQPKLDDLLTDAVVENGRLKGQKLQGAFLSPELSFDSKEILFASTQCQGDAWSPESSFHIFRMNVDGTGLTQLNDGSWNEFDPCWLPNGRIVFISERRGGFGRCHPRPVPTYTLFSMNRDGGDIVPLSYHETNEWNPSINNNGMIVYTRWDYIDRGDCIAHHPWITFPDGRDPRAIHGNYPSDRRARPDTEMSIRAIPGSPLYVATASPHHGRSFGSLVVFDPRVEDDGAMSPLKRLTPYIPFPEVESGGKGTYGTAWPLSEDYFLCVCAPEQVFPRPGDQASNRRGRKQVTYGVYLLDSFGNRELLYRDPGLHAVDPIPFRPRPVPPVIPHATDVGLPEVVHVAPAPMPENATGTLLCMNVYDSRKPWPQGAKIKALRIIQVYPKGTYPVNDPDIGIGSESLARGVLGEVPVEEDGSVRFTVPAGKPIYFQAIDANGMAIQSMQSATYVHPGESLTCQGCHEPRHRASSRPKHLATAARNKARDLTPGPSGSDPLTFPRLVQPVLDRKCVSCHAKEKKAPDLSGQMATWDRPGYGGGKKSWSASYIALTTGNYTEDSPKKGFTFAFSARPPERTPTRTTPGEFGARASTLYQMLSKGHHDVKLTPDELQRIVLWLDCNSNFYGAYHDLDKQADGEVVRPLIE